MGAALTPSYQISQLDEVVEVVVKDRPRGLMLHDELAEPVLDCSRAPPWTFVSPFLFQLLVLVGGGVPNWEKSSMVTTLADADGIPHSIAATLKIVVAIQRICHSFRQADVPNPFGTVFEENDTM
ncbi:MAG TPA: hypothetical protein DDY91_09030 [Planctomycetaceae bacterium]|nr:hypothetical protein [Planctomycetaceae bacterium]